MVRVILLETSVVKVPSENLSTRPSKESPPWRKFPRPKLPRPPEAIESIHLAAIKSEPGQILCGCSRSFRVALPSELIQLVAEPWFRRPRGVVKESAMAARGPAGDQRGRGGTSKGRGGGRGKGDSTPGPSTREETDDDNRSWEVATETTPARGRPEENVEAATGERPGQEGEAEPRRLRDPWSDGQGDPWGEDRWWEESRRGWQDDWGSRWGSSDWWGNDRGKDYSDPPAWAGWAHYRLWRKSVTRWHNSTDIKMHRRADRVMRSMEWDLQARFEHLTDGELTDDQYLNRMLGVLDVLAGEKQTTEKRRAVRKALFEGNRKGDESLSQFALRREQEFAMAERYVSIPSDLKAILMEENAALGKQGVMNLRTLTSGAGDFDTVVKALKVLDTEEEGITNKTKGTHFSSSAAAGSEDVPREDFLAEESEASSIGSQDWREILNEVEKMDLDEHQVTEVFMAMEKEKRTWKENKKLKLARRKDRRHFSGGYKKGEGRDRGGPNISVDQMKRISRREPPRTRAKKVAFVFLGAEEEERKHNTFVGVAVSEFNGMAIPGYVMEILRRHQGGDLGESKGLGLGSSFLTIPAGHAIIDPGAGQDLIGAPSYARLKQQLATGGLKPIQIEEKPASASGVGGKATTLFQALIPCILGGAPGVVKVTVVAEDIPHLLSIGLLESAGSVINTQTNQIQFENIGTEDKMLRLRSGHRVVDISRWDGQPFPVPQEVQDKYGISEGAFNLNDCRNKEAYMCPAAAAQLGSDGWWNVPGTSMVFKVHSESRKGLYNPSQEGKNPSWLELLGDQRVTVRQRVSGEVECLADEWRKEEEGSCNQEWHGITVFTKNHEHGELCSSPQCFPSSNPCQCPSRDRKSSFCTLYGGAAKSHFMSRCSRGGEGLQGRDQASRRPAEEQGEGGELPSSSGMHRGGGQSIRPMATMSSMPDQDIVHPPPVPTGEEEEGQASGRGVRDKGGSDGDVSASYDGSGSHDAGSAVEPSGVDSGGTASHEDSERSSGTGMGQSGRGGTASMSEPEREESPQGAEDEDVSLNSGEEEKRVEGETEYDNLEGEGENVYEPLGGEEGDNEWRRGGPEYPEQSTTFLQAKLDNFYQIGKAAGNLEECEIFGAPDGEFTIAFEVPELRSYLENEDLNDDYEAPVPKNVQKVVKNLATTGAVGESTRTESKPFKIMELFSPPRVTKECSRFGCTTTKIPAYDLDCGWDFFNAKHRKEFWEALEEEEPDLVVMSPECRAFSQMMNVNWEKMDPGEARRIQVRGMAMFQFCIRVAEHQIRKKKWFLLEQPQSASSWRTKAAEWLSFQEGVAMVDFDQCQFGLRLGPLKQLVKKGTSFMLNHVGVFVEFYGKKCCGGHEHLRLEGGGLTRQAQVWPPAMVQHILRGVRKEWLRCHPEEEDAEEMYTEERRSEEDVYMEGSRPLEEEEEDEERDEAEDEDRHNRVKREQGISEELKQMVHRLHVNLGHLPLDRMKMMLKAANAKDEVLSYVRDKYHCEVCMRQRREITRRKAAFPRTFEFNRILGVDTFFVKWQGKSYPFLNMVDHGTNWQVVAMVRPIEGEHAEPSGGNPTAEETWLHFLRYWVRPHGTPDVVISDGGMEFRGRFERGLEQYGVLQNVTDQESPWQNGRVERHGLWVKDRMEMEVSAAGTIVQCINDLEALVIELVSCKNGWFSRGGYSPAQLVYGKNPRLPAELLSDAGQCTPGWDEVLCDATEGDTATAEFRRSHRIREKARKLAMENTCREKVREASKPPLHRHRSWAAGQWVMIWRTSKTATVRSRWVGPGLVILQTGHTVYVAVRSRLWKCNVDQLRPANEMEELGMQVVESRQYQELLHQMQQQRHGAVDVEREGPPPRGCLETPCEENRTEERGSYKQACRRRMMSGFKEGLEEEEGEVFWAAITSTSGNWAVTEAPRNGEITWSQMSPEEVKRFQESDLAEWKSLENEFKAVKVWSGKDAADLRRIYKDRIMTARVVRRKKPMPGLHQFKPKSRFCVHGHRDPDGGSFKTFAPTPSAEAFHMVCQTIANGSMLLLFADVKAAFAQSNPLKRPQGRLFVTPCDGTPLDPEDLIELIAPVYGLDDAPIRWYETVRNYLQRLGYCKSLLDPCVFVLHEEGKLKSMILIEVDDFCIASADKETEDWIKEKLQSKFQFGKWEVGEADFIGRHVKMCDGEIRFDQEKYIVEKIHPLQIPRGRRGKKEEPLEEEEFKEYRSVLYKVSWVAHQTRPEVSGAVAILASRLHKATIQDSITLNKAIGHLRSTSKQELRIRPFDPEKMTFIGVSDAGGVDGEVRGNGEDGVIEDPVQGAWLILASDAMPSHDKKVRVSVLSWRSSKLKRRVTSTMSGETLSLSQCLGELEWMQIFYRDLMFHDVEVRSWSRSLQPFIAMVPDKWTLRGRQEQGSVTDAKSLYDAVYKNCPTSRQDRRNALELAVVIDVVEKTGSQIRWTPHQRMPVDMLTKADVTTSNGALLHLIRGGCLKIDKEDEEMMRRQRSKAARSRSRRATNELLEEEAEENEFVEILNQILWST
eukprot:symbB.v1.2.026423.t1/scaffold2638.1/size74318/2